MPLDGFRAQVGHLLLVIERQDDHWALGVFDRERQWWMYRAQSTDADRAREILVEFAGFTLARDLADEDVIWTPY